MLDRGRWWRALDGLFGQHLSHLIYSGRGQSPLLLNPKRRYAMRTNLEGARIDNCLFGAGNKMLVMAQTLGATLTMDADMPQQLILDPGGAGRTILLPP